MGVDVVVVIVGIYPTSLICLLQIVFQKYDAGWAGQRFQLLICVAKELSKKAVWLETWFGCNFLD